MITVANLLSPVLDDLADEISRGLASLLNRDVRVTRATVDDVREGRAGIVLICGLAYVFLHDTAPDRFLAAAAPLVDDRRTRDEPVYFSDIVIAPANPAATLKDLKGNSLAYNEEISFSGYRALEHELEAQGLSWDLFAERFRTGSHHESLACVVNGNADVAAIDSHVLLLENRRDPAITESIKVMASLGPYPAPPVVINRSACDVQVDELRAQLNRLSSACMEKAAIRQWCSVDDAEYDAIRAATRGLPGLFVDQRTTARRG